MLAPSLPALFRAVCAARYRRSTTARIATRVAPVVLSLLIAAPGFATPEASGQSEYPLTIDNCGRELTFEAPPQRAVTLGQNSTEILLSLGLAERMAGSAVWVSPVAEPLAAANASVPRLSDGVPGFEAVVGQRPDLVAAQFQADLGPKGRVASREQFEDLGIATYISPTDCAARVMGDNTNRDGARTRLFTTELVHREIRELAAIFGVPARGEALIQRLREREAAAVARARAALDGDLSMLWWFSSAELSGDAWVAGRNGAPGYVMASLGVENVVKSDHEWPGVSWEWIAAANPDVLVLGEMSRRHFPADRIEQKIAFLESDPLTRQMAAVRNARFIRLDAQAMNPGLRTIEALEGVARALERLRAQGRLETSG